MRASGERGTRGRAVRGAWNKFQPARRKKLFRKCKMVCERIGIGRRRYPLKQIEGQDRTEATAVLNRLSHTLGR